MVCPVGAISEPAFQEAQKNPRFHGFAMPLQAATGPGFFFRPAAEFPVRIHFRLYQRKTSEWYTMDHLQLDVISLILNSRL